MVEKQCPYLIDNSTSTIKKAKCLISNDICPYIRFCSTKNSIVSSPLYTINGCLVQHKYESEK